MTGPDRVDAIHRWTTSGCRALTGPTDAPGLGPPDGFVAALDRVARRLTAASGAVGTPVTIDPLREVAMRAHLAGMSRHGRTSCGGAARLLRGADGDLALSLPRRDDVELVPALLGREVAIGNGPADDEVWGEIERWAGATSSVEIVERATQLGLAVAAIGPTPSIATGATTEVHVATSARVEQPRLDPRPADRPIRVLDLSSLWAGPLCGQLLGLAGCDVVKLESARRPDGSRSGPLAVHERLNRGKRCVAVDPSTDDGRATVAALLDAADVVIEASRPRALAAWKVGPDSVAGPEIWISITAHGYHGTGAHRIGFGDDVAVAAGLVATGAGGPWFCADAVADPLTGIVAATTALEALADRRRVHLDVAMVGVARQFAGHTVDASTVASGTDVVGLDGFPTMHGPLAEFGEHTRAVVRGWCP